MNVCEKLHIHTHCTEGKTSAGLTLWISHQPLLLHAVSLQPTSYGTINNTFITTSYHSPSFMSVLFFWLDADLPPKQRKNFSSCCCFKFAALSLFFPSSPPPLFSILSFPRAAIDFWRCSSCGKAPYCDLSATLQGICCVCSVFAQRLSVCFQRSPICALCCVTPSPTAVCFAHRMESIDKIAPLEFNQDATLMWISITGLGQ